MPSGETAWPSTYSPVPSERGVPAQDFIGRSEDEMLPAELAPRMRELRTARLLEKMKE